jgi:cell division protein ZapE
MSTAPLLTYQARVAAGELRPDAGQEAAARALSDLWLQLLQSEEQRQGWLARFRRGPAPKGLYLWGDVGRGKSMLMEVFYHSLPSLLPKRRVHFHAFMQEVHQRLRDLRATDETTDPLPRLARQLAREAQVLCFDEFHVTDIADAMLLKGLFEALFAAGVVVVATSNWPPEDLYKDGLQRERFLPFIPLLKAHCQVQRLDGPQDYRLAQLGGQDLYLVPHGAETLARLEGIFRIFSGGAPISAEQLTILGRTLSVPRAGGGAAWFAFTELCGQPLGAADYLALAEYFHAIVLVGVPVFDAGTIDQGKRFQTLVDVLYESRTHLACTAAAAPEALCPTGPLAFTFQRTASRLQEMRFGRGSQAKRTLQPMLEAQI